ncbi:MAG: TonB-dependent receptor [Flavobacteriales bacterium]|nr:TonB-dependent receptor [Flavobacteriales bacterium]
MLVPNNQLRPENAYNGEISFSKSFRKTIKEITSTDQKAELIRLSAGVFYTHLTNTIVRVDYQLNGQDSLLYDGEMAKIQTNSNARNAFIYGGTAEINFRFSPSIDLKSNITYTFGEDLANSTPLGHIPPIYGQTAINLVRRSWNLSLYSRYNGTKLAVDYAPSGEDNLPEATDDGTPFWYTLNLKGAWKMDEHFQIQAAVENILDQHYKQFASGISSPGRSFSLTLRTKF